MSTASSRSREYRARQKAGTIVLPVEINGVETVEALIVARPRVHLVSLCPYRSLAAPTR
jgi:hypothetical protein